MVQLCTTNEGDDETAARLLRAADDRHSVLDHERIRMLGASDGWVQRRRRHGWMRRIHPGTYLIGRRKLTKRGSWVAGVDAGGTGAMLIGVAGLAAWRIVGDWRVPACIEVVTFTRQRHRTGVRYRTLQWVRPEDVRIVDGIPCSSRAVALATSARHLTLGDLIKSISEAQFQQPDVLDELGTLLTASCNFQGRRRLERAIQRYVHGEHGFDSRYEQTLDRELTAAGAPPARLNVRLLLPDGELRVDRYYEEARLVVEADGAPHRARARQTLDAGRDARLRLAGIEPIRVPDHLPRAERQALIEAAARRACERRSGWPVTIIRCDTTAPRRQ